VVLRRHRKLFGRDATFAARLVCNCLVLIPVAGTLAAAIGWTAVLMMVFEEVEGISRLQPFGISAGINVCFFVLQQMMTPAARHL